MAENKGKTKGAILGAVQSAQMAVGSALRGGQMAMGGDSGASQSIPLLEDLRSIGRANEKNTESMLSIFKSMFIFDKEQAARLRDQSRENAQEVPAGRGATQGEAHPCGKRCLRAGRRCPSASPPAP